MTSTKHLPPVLPANPRLQRERSIARLRRSFSSGCSRPRSPDASEGAEAERGAPSAQTSASIACPLAREQR